MSTAMGDRIRATLKENPQRRDEFIEWYTKFKRTLEEETKADCEAALGLNIPTHELPFETLVPGDTWFSRFLDVTKDFESPKVFGFLASLVVFGQLVGARSWILRGGQKMWVAPSALLMSPAGEGRRSTICDFAVYQVGVPAGLPVIADSMSYEAMGDTIKDMTKDGHPPEVLIYAGELSTLLGKGSYGESIIPKLTDIIGKTTRVEWNTVKRGKVLFKSPCVNALWTSAPDWMASNIPSIAFEGGTWSRFLFGVVEGRDQFVTWTDPIDSGTLRELIQDLMALTRAAKGEVFDKPNGSAYKWYHEWYQAHSRWVRFGDLPDRRMRPYYSRKHDHLLRLAALLSLAAGEGGSFTEERFQQSLNILDWLEKRMPQAYSSMSLNPWASVQKKVVEVLKSSGGSMDHSRLHRRLYRDIPMAADFRVVMESLIQMGIVRGVMTPGGKGNQYILVRNLGEGS